MSETTRAFFLGGYDLEMQTIAELLARHVSPQFIHDKHLSWGATASDYAAEIKTAANEGLVPVLIELTVDRALPRNAILIDHHNERAGADQPTSLEQVFNLLQLPTSQWSRWYALVAANDRGYLPEMASIGATREEIIAIREADRRSQGITADEEQQALEAISRRLLHANEELTLIQLPHTRTAAASDRMELLLGGPGYKNLVIGTPSSVAFYGSGSLIDQLRSHIPNGWWGGALPKRGYWGANVSIESILPFLINALSRTSSPI